MKKITNILFKLELEGKGIVNNDSSDQKWIFANANSKFTNHLKSNHSNVTYAKKNLFHEKNGDLNYKIKIASDCLRNSMFRFDCVAQTSSYQHSPALLNSYIASVVGLVRGYMFTSNIESIKRDSPLTISDAEQTNTNVSNLELCAKSGTKSKTSLFYKENIGEITYSSNGNINIADLQFIPSDSVFDRVNFDADLYKSQYEKFAKMNIPNYDAEIGYFKMSTSVVDVFEYGAKLCDETTIFLIKETLKRILGINITRAGSYARVKSFKIKLVSDAISDTFKNSDGWITINSLEDIENLEICVGSFYEKVDDTVAKQLRTEIEANYQLEKTNKKAKVDIKKALDKKKKEATKKLKI